MVLLAAGDSILWKMLSEFGPMVPVPISCFKDGKWRGSCNLRLPKSLLYEGDLKHHSHKVPNSMLKFSLSFFFSPVVVVVVVCSLSDHFTEIRQRKVI